MHSEAVNCNNPLLSGRYMPDGCVWCHSSASRASKESTADDSLLSFALRKTPGAHSGHGTCRTSTCSTAFERSSRSIESSTRRYACLGVINCRACVPPFVLLSLSYAENALRGTCPATTKSSRRPPLCLIHLPSRASLRTSSGGVPASTKFTSTSNPVDNRSCASRSSKPRVDAQHAGPKHASLTRISPNNRRSPSRPQIEELVVEGEDDAAFVFTTGRPWGPGRRELNLSHLPPRREATTRVAGVATDMRVGKCSTSNASRLVFTFPSDCPFSYFYLFS